MRELAILTVSYHSGATYESGHHLEFARRAGLTESHIATVAVPDDNPDFRDLQRAVIRYASAMTVNAAVPKDLFDDIAIIGNQAVVELTMTIGFYT